MSGVKLRLLAVLFLITVSCAPSQGRIKPTGNDRGNEASPMPVLNSLVIYPPLTAQPGSTLTMFEQSLHWTRQFGTTLTDWVSDVVCDVNGNILLIGSLGSSLGPRIYGITGTVQKINQDGEEIWSKRIGAAPGAFADYSIATDNSGNVIVAGQIAESFSDSFSFIGKYDSEGNELWMRTIPPSYDTIPSDVAVDLYGNVYLTGRARIVPENDGEDIVPERFLRKYSPDGEVLWTVALFQDVYNLKVFIGIDGNVRVAGNTSGILPNQDTAGGRDIFIQMYSPIGDEIWTHQFGSSEDDMLQDADIDKEGNSYIAYLEGRVTDPGFPMLTKYDSAGDQIWTKRLDSIKVRNMSLTIAQSGHLYLLVKRSYSSPPADADIRKLDITGNELWRVTFPSSWPAVPEFLAVDAFDSLYLSGDSNDPLPGHEVFEDGSGDLFLLRLDLR